MLVLHGLRKKLPSGRGVVGTAILSLCFLFPQRAPAQATFITIDVPGAQETQAFGISKAGAITGEYLDASNVYHGFVRASDGTITTFDVPDAGGGANQGTFGVSINDTGTIAGNY